MENKVTKQVKRPETATNPVQLHINKERCKGCGYCVDFCPKKAIKMSREMNTRGYFLPKVNDMTECRACGFCELICPEFAIRISSPRKSGAN